MTMCGMKGQKPCAAAFIQMLYIANANAPSTYDLSPASRNRSFTRNQLMACLKLVDEMAFPLGSTIGNKNVP